MTTDQRTELEWRDGITPVSVQFDDPYFSIENGLAETRHVFMAGNGLPDRFVPGFQIAELGFGTGLNMLTALLDWRVSDTFGPLRFTSFEAYPLEADQIETALAAFPEAQAIAGPFLDQWRSGKTYIETDDLIADIRIGDAREMLPLWHGLADAWFLDGFSPVKNPELWEESLIQQVAKHTAPNCTCATYTAAGFVRRALSEAGFTVTRQTGFGRKRHMTTAVMETKA
ncbi:tRNA (5-methylaminomethyl-2-thiouridine)(34)-methyltransferase MnmD [Pseudohalocynthiibacter aestuariivivens]|jgi:tRNA U34 5-methylaminomethyl-2-thiouridine-forming methyltransferase MnmC|uniref:tRNA (5-methylaminomethyl-2-thiouridine)(34)-methyltransferase MnmD n=1 Tax=Pseudohalocynthiibacter aestuariivivens TaxID=1591409 RepID=A0ABV5JJ26_9RHOB|nr:MULTISPECIES: tRNA (5-methylaminomethyl-2-thiouridine)(34)-methyltransferase MnmD [Pseudohalocynthiibacter]MBS9715422.1 tRNA (5-methylaminomethyl-2-thiouridine)(34)-methyltransferase MnmD [Pseudohalocynthiibacter aestuariivivens]MCK0102632.1 tRNA (5-methylaminomethyl-2-thiouridine)(34)-methyltransferase MnmD [Pseudohalocynthiibacter sp. F2068]